MRIIYKWRESAELGYRKLKHVIKKTFQYACFVWKHNDHDWDYQYLMQLIDWKLGLMADTIETNNIIEGNHRVAKQIRYAKYLLKQIADEVPIHKAHKEFEEKWGEVIFGPQGIMYKHIKTKEDQAKARLDLQQLYEKERKALADLEKRLARHVMKYYQKWWD